MFIERNSYFLTNIYAPRQSADMSQVGIVPFFPI